MSKSISINVEPKITPGTAKLCAATLEIFLTQNPEIDLVGTTHPDGSIGLEFRPRTPMRTTEEVREMMKDWPRDPEDNAPTGGDPE